MTRRQTITCVRASSLAGLLLGVLGLGVAPGWAIEAGSEAAKLTTCKKICDIVYKATKDVAEVTEGDCLDACTGEKDKESCEKSCQAAKKAALKEASSAKLVCQDSCGPNACYSYSDCPNGQLCNDPRYPFCGAHLLCDEQGLVQCGPCSCGPPCTDTSCAADEVCNEGGCCSPAPCRTNHDCSVKGDRCVDGACIREGSCIYPPP